MRSLPMATTLLKGFSWLRMEVAKRARPSPSTMRSGASSNSTVRPVISVIFSAFASDKEEADEDGSVVPQALMEMMNTAERTMPPRDLGRFMGFFQNKYILCDK